ncbi:MAG: SIR2 family protein [Pyrinomonadaceae bacterium]
MKVLIFGGAGTSVELGVPAMRDMVVRLNEYFAERKLAPTPADKLTEFLKDPSYDMEQLIEELDHMTAANSAYAHWGTTPTAVIEGLSVFRQEAEWFVNHMCERVDASHANLMWGATLDALAGHRAVIATTNYDRAIEIAAARRNLKLYDGFADFGEDEWTQWKGFAGQDEKKLLKVHGSTDWYHSAEGDDVWKLRHPMPLFGRVTMQVDAPSPLKLRSAAILPSREKKMNLHPYPDLAFEFRSAVDESELTVFIGTSLRDPDMRGLYRKSAQRVPTFVVGRSVQIPSGAGGFVIRQTASKFLSATLPSALLSSDPLSFLQAQTGERQPDDGVLDQLAAAIDISRGHHSRCDAIEKLADAAVAFPAATIRPLLHDEDSDIRTFALALVSSCPDNSVLLAEARTIAQSNDDTVFRQELEILESLLIRTETQ